MSKKILVSGATGQQGVRLGRSAVVLQQAQHRVATETGRVADAGPVLDDVVALVGHNAALEVLAV